MFKALRRRRPARREVPPFDIEIVFLDEAEDERDDVNTFRTYKGATRSILNPLSFCPSF